MAECLVVGNWKMNLDLADALVLSSTIKKNSSVYKNLEIVILPPSIFIPPIFEKMRQSRSKFSLGIQNVMNFEKGEFTGEISPGMSKRFCKWALVGHSERRKYFGETDEIINQKIKLCLKNNLKVIACVGEKERYHLEDHFSYEEKRMKKKGGILHSLQEMLQGVKDFDKIAIAYEPVWAIGSMNAASGAYFSAVCYLMRSFLKDQFGESAEKIKILYGGSVNSQNAGEFMCQPNIDGLLVGGASLKAREFMKICRVCSERGIKSGK